MVRAGRGFLARSRVAAKEVLVVTTPEPELIGDTYATIKVLAMILYELS